MKTLYVEVTKILDDEFLNAVRDTFSGLNVLEAHVLTQLHEHGDSRASELARSVGRAPTSFTSTLDGLERNGYIVRKADPTDRRAVLLSLTTAGQKVSPTLKNALTSANAATTKRLQGMFAVEVKPC